MQRCIVAGDHVIAMQQHGRADSDRCATDRRDQWFVATRQCVQEPDNRCTERAALRHRDEIVEVIARAKDLGSASEQQTSHARVLAGVLNGSRHRFIHDERQRVFLFRPVHPDFQDRAFIGDENVGHWILGFAARGVTPLSPSHAA